MDEIVIVVLVLLGLLVLVAPLLIAVIALARTLRIGRLEQRLKQLEARLAGVEAVKAQAPPPTPTTAAAEPAAEEGTPQAEEVPPVEAAPPPTAELVEPVVVAPPPLPTPLLAREVPESNLEYLIGRRALGWVAVLLLFFAAAFFLRYAYVNDWIGPIGQVTLIQLAGLALVLGGKWHADKGWRRFSLMLSAAGIVIIYLATFGAFSFYQLMPQRIAGVFMVIVIVEAALLALSYDSSVLALVAVIGGLLTPVLLQSDHDQYRQLFTYLAVLDAGVVLLLVLRRWPLIGTVAMVGTYMLFWSWYGFNYHPEKLAWAIGFHAAVFSIFRSELWFGDRFRKPAARVPLEKTHDPFELIARVEELIRIPLSAALAFGAAYTLLNPDYHAWMGTLAVAFAVVYAQLAQRSLNQFPTAQPRVLTALAVAVSFVALAIPLEAEARWISLGWAAEAAALWWFGLRIRSIPLKAMAAVPGFLSIARLVIVDTPGLRDPFIPIFNQYALSALAVVACVLGSYFMARRFKPRISPGEFLIVRLVGVLGVVLLWWVLSIETHGFFDALGHRPLADQIRWEWTAQMALSILWAIYASGLLAIGFWKQLPALRWLAFGFYALTVAKVLLFDMGELDEIYRILAFFVLSVLLGAAAWAYHRFRPGRQPGGLESSS